MTLLKDALADVGVSVEEFQAIPADATLVEETVVSPTDSPSSTVAVPATVVEEVVPAPAPIEQVIVDTIAPSEAVIEDVVNEHELLQEKADELIGLQTAMEQYHALVRKTGFKGITPQSAEFLQVHLKQVQSKLGITTKIGSMEAFHAKDSREQHDLATISLEDIKATSKAALDKFLEIVQKVIEYLKRAGLNVWDGITHLESAIDKLDQQLGALKKPGGEGTYKSTNPILVHHDQVHHEVEPDIQGLAHFASTTYPQEVVKFLNGITTGVNQFDGDGAGVEEVEAFLDEYAGPLKGILEREGDTDDMPGGYKLVISENGLSLTVEHTEDLKPHESELEVQTTLALRKTTRELKALAGQLKQVRPGLEKVSQAGQKLMDATKKVMAKSDEAVGNELARKVGLVIQESSPRAPEIIEYIVKYAKALCVDIATQIRIIESSGKAEK